MFTRILFPNLKFGNNTIGFKPFMAAAAKHGTYYFRPFRLEAIMLLTKGMRPVRMDKPHVSRETIILAPAKGQCRDQQ